jgi:hypothetical protein
LLNTELSASQQGLNVGHAVMAMAEEEGGICVG